MYGQLLKGQLIHALQMVDMLWAQGWDCVVITCFAEDSILYHSRTWTSFGGWGKYTAIYSKYLFWLIWRSVQLICIWTNEICKLIYALWLTVANLPKWPQNGGAPGWGTSTVKSVGKIKGILLDVRFLKEAYNAHIQVYYFQKMYMLEYSVNIIFLIYWSSRCSWLH